MIKIIKNKNWTLFCIIASILFILNLIFPNQTDDITHYFNATNAQQSFFASYFNWNGRFGELLWTGYLARFIGSWGMNLANALVGATFIFAFFYLIFARLPNSKKDFPYLALICSALINFNFSPIFLWFSGSLNYLWGVSLIIIFLIPYRLIWQKIYIQAPNYNLNLKSRIFPLGLFLLAIPAGCPSEQMGALVCLALAVSLLHAYYQKIKLPLWYNLGAVGFWSGWLILFSSPGSAKRAIRVTADGNFISISQLLNLTWLEKLTAVNQTFNNHAQNDIFTLFLGLFLIFYARQMKLKFYQVALLAGIFLTSLLIKFFASILIFILVLSLMLHLAKLDKKYIIYAILFGAWALVGLILIQFPNGIPARGRFGSDIMLIALIVLMFKDICLTSSYSKYCTYGSYGILLVSLIFCFHDVMLDRYTWINIEHLIQKQKAQGIENVVIPRSYFPKNNPDFWINPDYAHYYHIKTLTIE